MIVHTLWNNRLSFPWGSRQHNDCKKTLTNWKDNVSTCSNWYHLWIITVLFLKYGVKQLQSFEGNLADSLGGIGQWCRTDSVPSSQHKPSHRTAYVPPHESLIIIVQGSNFHFYLSFAKHVFCESSSTSCSSSHILTYLEMIPDPQISTNFYPPSTLSAVLFILYGRLQQCKKSSSAITKCITVLVITYSRSLRRITPEYVDLTVNPPNWYFVDIKPGCIQGNFDWISKKKY